MIKIWTDGSDAGLLERSGDRGSTFAYLSEARAERGVSVTMPVRLASWGMPFGLSPIFEMNLPEGALRERLRLAFAKATGTFDDFDLLGVVGRSQVGRIRFTGQKEGLDEEVPFQSVDEILARRRDGGLYRYLIEKFAEFSGISGVQPKILIRDERALGGRRAALSESPGAQSHRGATHIVKFWDNSQYAQLAANEYFCLRAAAACGLEVPGFQLAEDGSALVVERFDLRADGTYRGFEDFCVLNAKGTDRKYSGSYETSILKRFTQFATPEHEQKDVERLFTLVVLNCVLRNGDAHLKNFGIVYDEVLGAARLAPVYDLVTTTVYLPKDGMALTLEGSTKWPDAKTLQRLGETRASLKASLTREVFERVGEAILSTKGELVAYAAEHPEFAEVGARMMVEWEAGLAQSLG